MGSKKIQYKAANTPVSSLSIFLYRLVDLYCCSKTAAYGDAKSPGDWRVDVHRFAAENVGDGQRREQRDDGRVLSEDDELLLTPERETRRQEGTLDVSGLADEQLMRAVMTMYVSGFDVISLEAGRITTDQRSAIRDATQRLVGVEVLEEIQR